MKILNRKNKILLKCFLPICIFVIFFIVLFCEKEVEFEYVGSFTVDTSEPAWYGCNWAILKKYGFWDIAWLDELLKSSKVIERDDFTVAPDGVYVYCRGYTLDKITYKGFAFLHKLHLENRYDATAYLRPDYDHPNQVNLYVLHSDIAIAIEKDPHNLNGYTAIWHNDEYIRNAPWYIWYFGS